jgi:thiol-disulfide isomerase/thioredoxin
MPNYRLFSAFLIIIAAGSALLATSARASASLDLDAYAGRVVVVDFWASWCVPCRRSFPWLNRMHARYADDGLVIIGVNVDAERDAANEFLAAYPADFRIYFDNQGDLAKDFQVEAMPSSFVIGRDGEVVARHLGFKVKKQDEYEAILVEALGGQP